MPRKMKLCQIKGVIKNSLFLFLMTHLMLLHPFFISCVIKSHFSNSGFRRKATSIDFTPSLGLRVGDLGRGMIGFIFKCGLNFEKINVDSCLGGRN